MQCVDEMMLVLVDDRVRWLWLSVSWAHIHRLVGQSLFKEVVKANASSFAKAICQLCSVIIVDVVAKLLMRCELELGANSVLQLHCWCKSVLYLFKTQPHELEMSFEMV